MGARKKILRCNHCLHSGVRTGREENANLIEQTTAGSPGIILSEWSTHIPEPERSRSWHDLVAHHDLPLSTLWDRIHPDHHIVTLSTIGSQRGGRFTPRNTGFLVNSDDYASCTLLDKPKMYG